MTSDRKIRLPVVGKADEVARVRWAYDRRDAEVDPSLYSPFDPAHRLLHVSRQRALLEVFRRNGIHTLSGLKVLDVGCGAADILVEFIGLGAAPYDLYGVDVRVQELSRGRTKCPSLRLSCADARRLPFPDGSFDVVTQFTLLSSVLDSGNRKAVADEMRRVLAPGGVIVSYDFWPDNPRNHDVRGVPRNDIERLFPGCRIDVKKTVLAPPLARPLAPRLPALCMVLEWFPPLRSHLMTAVFPPVRVPSEHTRIVVTGRPQDVPQVVDVHMDSFQSFFLTFLGPAFLRLYYKRILADPGGLILVAVSDRGVEGFVAGTTNQSRFYRSLIDREAWRFAIASMGAFLRRPRILPRLLRAFSAPKKARDAASECCLFSIAVSVLGQGKGVGRELVEAFCDEMARRECRSVCLMTDRDENERTNRFYVEAGFVLVRSFQTPEGRWMNEYLRDLPKRSEEAKNRA